MALRSSTWWALLGVICSGCGPRPLAHVAWGPPGGGDLPIGDGRKADTPPARCESLFRRPIAPVSAMPGSGDPRVTFGQELLTLHDISGDDRWSPPVREHASYAWSPDETSVISVTGSHDGPVELFVWDARTGAALALWSLPSSLAHLADLAVAPDKGSVAMLALDAQENTRLVLVSLANGRVEELGPTQRARKVSYATNGRRILVHDREGGAPSIWDVRSRRWLFREPEPSLGVSLLPDGERRVVLRKVAGQNWTYAIEVWSLGKANPTRQFLFKSEATPRLRLSQDGHVMAVSGDIVRAWQVDDGQPLKGAAVEAQRLEISRQGNLAFTRRCMKDADSFSYLEETYVWDLRTGERLFGGAGTSACNDELRKEEEGGYLFPFDDRHLLNVGNPHAYVIDPRHPTWDFELPRRVDRAQSLLLVSPSHHHVLLDDGESRFVPVDIDHRPSTSPRAHGRVLRVSPDGSLALLMGRDGRLRLDGERCVELAGANGGYHGPMADAVFSLDGRWLLAKPLTYLWPSALLWQVPSGHLVNDFRINRNSEAVLLSSATQLVVQPTNTELPGAVPNDTRYHIVDASRRRTLRSLPDPSMSLSDAASIGGRVVSTWNDHFLIAPEHWKLPLVEGGKLQSFHAPSRPLDGPATQVEVSHDDRYLAVGTAKGEIHIWDLQNMTLSTFLPALGKAIAAVAFSPDASLVAFAADQTIRVADAKTGRTLASVDLNARYDAAQALAFSSDGALLIAYTNRGARIQFRVQRALHSR